MPQRFIRYFVQQINKFETLPHTTMKINYTSKIGSVVLATLLTGLMNSCASHKTSAVTPINLPKSQIALAAPKSLEGAWIKLRSHDPSSGTHIDWWYIKNGEAHHYWDSPDSAGGAMVNGHPVSPTSLGRPQYSSVKILPSCEDSLGRHYVLASYTYVPTGATAKLSIKNDDRHETTLCRSASMEKGYAELSNEPALITFKSADQGVYEGTIKGVLGAWGMGVQHVDSITIFTR